MKQKIILWKETLDGNPSLARGLIDEWGGTIDSSWRGLVDELDGTVVRPIHRDLQ